MRLVFLFVLSLSLLPAHLVAEEKGPDAVILEAESAKMKQLLQSVAAEIGLGKEHEQFGGRSYITASTNGNTFSMSASLLTTMEFPGLDRIEIPNVGKFWVMYSMQSRFQIYPGVQGDRDREREVLLDNLTLYKKQLKAFEIKMSKKP